MNIPPASVLRFLPLRFRQSITNASENELRELSEAYSTLGEVSAYAVVAGVALELVAAFVPLKPSFQAAIPDALILIGVAGEVLSGSRLRIASEALGRFAEQRIAEANLRAAEANEKAENERLARAQLEAKFAARRLSPEQTEQLVQVLSQFAADAKARPTASVTTLFPQATLEATMFAGDIASAFTKAGWWVKPLRDAALSANLTGLQGVAVLPDETEIGGRATSALFKYFASAGIPVMGHSSVSQTSLVTVLVGDHPHR